jgi:hypothetical protein
VAVASHRVLRGNVGVALKEQADRRLAPELRGQLKGRGALGLRPKGPSQAHDKAPIIFRRASAVRWTFVAAFASTFMSRRVFITLVKPLVEAHMSEDSKACPPCSKSSSIAPIHMSAHINRIL